MAKQIGAKAPNVSGLPSPKTPPSVRHQTYPVEAPRITALKTPTRDYGKQTKPPKLPSAGGGMGPVMGLPIGGGF